MKRIAGLTLVLFLAVGFFAFAVGARQSASDGRTRITYSLWGSNDELRTMQGVCDTFNNSQNRIFVTPELIPWETYQSVLTTRLTAGTMPDAGMVQEASVQTFAAAGLLANVSNMYPANDRPLDSVTFKDARGNPVAYSSANEILLLYYNKDMFDRAGVPYPPTNVANAWTWDQFVDVAKRLTLDRNNRTPNDAGFDRNNIVQYGASVNPLAWQLEVWTLSNGGGFYSSDGRSVIIDRPESIEAIQRVADLYLVHGVAPFRAGLTDDQIPATIVAGNVAMSTCGQWNIGTALSSARDQQGLNYGIGVLPYMRDKVTINTAGAVAVFTGPRQAAAEEFVRWYVSEENNWALIESGIWMPAKMRWYTDESLTRRWVMNPAFPPYADYKSAVVDYTLSSAKPTAWYYTQNTDVFNPLLQSILGDVWTGRTTARDAINNNIAALRRAHAGQ
jgi:multiple sugar transport system substrate-binding protein